MLVTIQAEVPCSSVNISKVEDHDHCLAASLPHTWVLVHRSRQYITYVYLSSPFQLAFTKEQYSISSRQTCIGSRSHIHERTYVEARKVDSFKSYSRCTPYMCKMAKNKGKDYSPSFTSMTDVQLSFKQLRWEKDDDQRESCQVQGIPQGA